METAYLLSSKKNADRLFESVRQIKDGVGVSIDLNDICDTNLMFTDLEVIKTRIFEVRGVQVMLDFELAFLYRVDTKVLNQSVKRNLRRFPSDFMFQLTQIEWVNLKSQIVTSSWGGLRRTPYAFTEQGLAMLSGILNSDIAIEVNISIMRAFVSVRSFLVQNPTIKELDEIKSRLNALESIDEDYQKAFDEIYIALSQLSINQHKTNVRNRIGYNL